MLKFYSNIFFLVSPKAGSVKTPVSAILCNSASQFLEHLLKKQDGLPFSFVTR